MTRLPFKVRFWKRKLDKERFTLPVSGTLARRVTYAGLFFYASFLVHGYFVYDNTTPADEPVKVAARDEKPLERGLLEPVIERLLGAERRAR